MLPLWFSTAGCGALHWLPRSQPSVAPGLRPVRMRRAYRLPDAVANTISMTPSGWYASRLAVGTSRRCAPLACVTVGPWMKARKGPMSCSPVALTAIIFPCVRITSDWKSFTASTRCSSARPAPYISPSMSWGMSISSAPGRTFGLIHDATGCSEFTSTDLAGSRVLGGSRPLCVRPVNTPTGAGLPICLNASAASTVNSIMPSTVAATQGTVMLRSMSSQQSVPPSGSSAFASRLRAFAGAGPPLLFSPAGDIPRRSPPRRGADDCAGLLQYAPNNQLRGAASVEG
mmetsp:Transcript_17376/g.45169  ORF Transcript_17376/g.45169 Transcript_17376/m.45169 type:complete len:287 (-) Transcript_17376:50-910(-)